MIRFCETVNEKKVVFVPSNGKETREAVWRGRKTRSLLFGGGIQPHKEFLSGSIAGFLWQNVYIGAVLRQLFSEFSVWWIKEHPQHYWFFKFVPHYDLNPLQFRGRSSHGNNCRGTPDELILYCFHKCLGRSHP